MRWPIGKRVEKESSRGIHVSGVHAQMRDQQQRVLHHSAAYGEATAGSETAAGQAEAAPAHARARGAGGRMAQTCAARLLPISRGAGQPTGPATIPNPDWLVLVAGAETAQPAGPVDRGPVEPIAFALAAQSPRASSLPNDSLCRHTSKVGAVCVSSARTDLCGGAISDGRPYRDRSLRQPQAGREAAAVARYASAICAVSTKSRNRVILPFRIVNTCATAPSIRLPVALTTAV